MKKLLITLAIPIFFLYSFETTAQITLPSSWTIDHSWSPPKTDTSLFKLKVNSSSRSGDWYDCPPNSVFGQELVQDAFYGFFSLIFIDGNDTMLASIVMEDYYDVNSDVLGINFWGLLFTEDSLYTQPITQDFLVLVGEDFPNEEPDHEFSISAKGKPFFMQVDNDSIPAYRFTANFPESIHLTDGFISILQVADTNTPVLFAWLATPNGDQMSYVMGWDIFGNSGEGMIPVDFAFCLTNYNLIPVKNWAVYFTILLLIGFTLYRFRKHYG